jgi:hypothetical protein
MSPNGLLATGCFLGANALHATAGSVGTGAAATGLLVFGCAARELSTRGNREALIARLRKDDAEDPMPAKAA